MSRRSDFDLLNDIIDSMERILSYTSGIQYSTFKTDSKTQDAVIRNVEVMGEATKLLSLELKTKHSNVPWKSIAGTRDKLIHDYFGVNIDVVWNIAISEIPVLLNKIRQIQCGLT